MDATEIRRRNARMLADEDESEGMPGFGRDIDRAQAQVSAIIGSHPTRGIGQHRQTCTNFFGKFSHGAPLISYLWVNDT